MSFGPYQILFAAYLFLVYFSGKAYCPTYQILGQVTDMTDQSQLKLRANFKIEKPEAFIGEIISQSVELEYLDEGNVMKVDCDNCLWTAPIDPQSGFEPRAIGPLQRDMTYVPIISITTNLNLQDGNSGIETGVSTTSCRGKSFVTTLWYCLTNNQNITSSQVCDGKFDCDDHSDEDPIRCKGSLDPIWIYNILTYFGLGCLILPGNYF